MSDAKLVNIARLMTTYNFVIEELPDNLRCTQCRLVLKVACQVPCGCRICQACINELMSRGREFCPGDSENCGESPLIRFTIDYMANKSVSRLTAKCPLGGCVHECQLANMEEHLRECQKKTEKCHSRELGCTQDQLAAEEMSGYLQQGARRHSEILIGMIANINRAIEMLKHELVLRDNQIGSIKDQMKHLENENKLIKDEMKSLKEEKEVLANKVGLGQIDAHCEWLIETVIRKARWSWGDKRSEYFCGAVCPYKYQLGSANYDSPEGAALYVYLYIHRGPNDRRLPWPFEATVVITVKDKDRHEVCRSISKQCQIAKPLDNSWRRSDDFMFLHSELVGTGLNLDCEVLVSCVVYLDTTK